MNTANLQIEGVLVALSALASALRQKGLLTEAEIETALADAEASVAADDRRPAELSASNVAAIAFPLRYLRVVNRADPESGLPSFTDVATKVGRLKPAAHGPSAGEAASSGE